MEEFYRRTKLGITSMNDSAYKQLETLTGLCNNTTSYPCSYDVLLSQEYSEMMGYKPVYLRNF
jgi:hypothetical protein